VIEYFQGNQIKIKQNTMDQNPTEQREQPPTSSQPKKSNTSIVLIIVAVVVVLGIVALAGGYFVMKSLKAKVSQKVGQKMGENMLEKAIEKGTGQKADVNAEDGSVSIKTESGTFSASESGNIKLPSDFPSDVFTYPDAKITFATTTPANAADGTTASYMVAYSVKQSAADAVAKYKAEMAGSGWTVETEANFGAMMINFKKGNRDATVTIGESQDDKTGTTDVSVTVSES